MRGVLKSAWLGVLFAAMVLRALQPQGWMPNTGQTGGALMPCPGMTRDSMASMPGMPHDAPAAPTQHDHGNGTLCVFAAAPPLSTPAVALPVPAPAPAGIAIAFAPARAERFTARAFRPNAARAPPSHA